MLRPSLYTVNVIYITVIIPSPLSHTGEWEKPLNKDVTHKLSRPNADFAFALYRNLNAKTDAGKNIFYSPLGISTALSMVSTGAGGDTHSQLFSILGYGALNQSQVNEEFLERNQTLLLRRYLQC
uniref:Serpin domain-containing protein n=1 Tax=Acanthochromis polyacanthus TaxID=80966 RepID=A0A3Q1FSA2_9TELE